METIKLSSKGQLVIPKSVRDAFDWKRGMEFCVEPVKEGVLLRPMRIFAPTRIHDVLGCAGYEGHRKTMAEMSKALRKAAGTKRVFGRFQRSR